MKDRISEQKHLQLGVQNTQLSTHFTPFKYAWEILPWKGEWPLKAEIAEKQRFWHYLLYFPSSAGSSQTEVFWRKKSFWVFHNYNSKFSLMIRLKSWPNLQYHLLYSAFNLQILDLCIVYNFNPTIASRLLCGLQKPLHLGTDYIPNTTAKTQ